jgi:hypothetical protein
LLFYREGGRVKYKRGWHSETVVNETEKGDENGGRRRRRITGSFASSSSSQT